MKKLNSVSLFTIIALALIFSAISSSASLSVLLVTTKVGAVPEQQQVTQSSSGIRGPQTSASHQYKIPSLIYPSSGSSPFTPLPYQTQRAPPIAKAVTNQRAYAGSTVMLDGMGSHVSYPGGTIVHYRWFQISGIPVTLFGSNTAVPTFIAPLLPTTTTTTTPEIDLIFSLTVTDSAGLTSTNPSTTNVIVTSNPQYHYLHPIPPTNPQYPNPGEQQLPQPYPYQQPLQQRLPQVTNNAVPSSSYPYQNRSAPPVIHQFSHNTSPYPNYYSPYTKNVRQHPYQNQSSSPLINSAQYPHNAIPYLNSTQYHYQYSGPTNYTTTTKATNTLQKLESATNGTRPITKTTEDNKTILQSYNTPTSSTVNPRLSASASNPKSNNSTSPNPVNNNLTKTATSAPTAASAAAANTSNISNANQNKTAEGVQFLGQTNVRTLKLLVPGANAQLRVTPFHPKNPVAFANAKRQAELSHIKPQIKVFSHQNANNRTAASSLLSSSTQTSALVTSLSGFDGLTQSQAGVNNFIFNPPDVQLAAGSTYVVEMVNLGGEIFTKQGSSVQTFALPTFFKITGTSDHVTDPKLIYDAISGRWFASIADTTTNDVRIAVSATNEPTGVWNVYRLGFSTCPDQPMIGINDDKFAVSANDFASNCNGAYTGAQYYIMDKSDLVAGVTSPRSIQSQPDTSTFSLHPVHSLGSTSTLFMVDDNSFTSSSSIIRLYSFTGSVPSITKNVVSFNIQKTNVPPGALQPGTTTPTLDTTDDRVQDAAWYQGKMWLTFDDACTPPGDTSVRACIRLDQLDTTANKVLQDFDKGDSGVYYFYPALRMDSGGNLDLIYGSSSANTFPSLSASGQAVGAPINTLDQSLSLKSGSAADTSGRYGDYFGAGVDPSNANNVWVAGEYHSTSQWSTFIAQTTRSTANANGWSGYASLGGNILGDPASARNSDGRLEVFVVQSDHSLYHKSETVSGSSSGWTAYSSLGGSIISNSASARNSDGRLEVFVIGNDHALYHKSQVTPGSSSWNGFAKLGGYFISDPVVAQNSDGRLQVFVIGSSHALYTISQIAASSSSWSGFSNLGGTIANNTKPAAVLNSAMQLQVFIINTDNAVFYKYQTTPGSATWSDYLSLRGSVITNPVVASNSDGRLELFVVGSNHALYHNFQLK